MAGLLPAHRAHFRFAKAPQTRSPPATMPALAHQQPQPLLWHGRRCYPLVVMKSFLLVLTFLAVVPLYGGLVREQPESEDLQKAFVNVFLQRRELEALVHSGDYRAALASAQNLLVRIRALQHRLSSQFRSYPPGDRLNDDRILLERLIEALRDRLGLSTTPATPSHTLQRR